MFNKKDFYRLSAKFSEINVKGSQPEFNDLEGRWDSYPVTSIYRKPRFENQFFDEYTQTNVLKDWLLYEEWSVEEAALLFLDLQPDGEVTYYIDYEQLDFFRSISGNFDVIIDEINWVQRWHPMPSDEFDIRGKEYLLKQEAEAIKEIKSELIKYIRYLDRYEKVSPQVWVELATEKGIHIPWLEWAYKNDYLEHKNSKPKKSPSLNDEDNSTKPWNIHTEGDPYPDQPWYTQARFFARQALKENPLLINSREKLAKEVLKIFKKHRIKKRGGTKDFTHSTIIKAFTNVNFR